MQVSASDPDLLARLGALDADGIDALDFGVIGFDDDETVTVYNRHEASLSGLDPSRVLGRHLFDQVAPCTNNALVAERFRSGSDLDEVLDYVFTLRMKPSPVRLRLLAGDASPLRYMIVEWNEST